MVSFERFVRAALKKGGPILRGADMQLAKGETKARHAVHLVLRGEK